MLHWFETELLTREEMFGSTTMAYVVVRIGGESLTWDEKLGAGIEPLTANLWNRYGDAVSSGRYSKNGDWHEFTEEVARIKAALQAER